MTCQYVSSQAACVEGDLDRLAQAVKLRRLAMGGLSQSEAATVAGVSDTTWNQIERAQATSERSLAKVGQALWGDPSAPAAILTGGDPPEPATPASDATPELLQAVRDLTAVVVDLRDELRRGRR